MLKSKYSFNVFWSEGDSCFIAKSPEFPGLSAFGSTQSEAIEEANIALEMFIEDMIEEGESLPEPISEKNYSGQFRTRIPRSLHQQLAQTAEKEGISLNMLIVNLLSEQITMHEVKKEIQHISDQVEVFAGITPLDFMTSMHYQNKPSKKRKDFEISREVIKTYSSVTKNICEC